MYVRKADLSKCSTENNFPFKLLALPTNIRLDWEGLPGTNTVAYYERLKLRAQNIFNIGP